MTMMTADKMNSVTLTISTTEKFNYVTQTLTFTMMTKTVFGTTMLTMTPIVTNQEHQNWKVLLLILYKNLNNYLTIGL